MGEEHIKRFEVTEPRKESDTNYHEKLLHIINEVNIKVRSIAPEKNKSFFDDIHEKKSLDATREIQEFEGVRQDVCDSFGVKNDDEHVYIHKGPPEVGNQRAMRAFSVLIDSLTKESFYGEGRIDHATLFKVLAGRLAKIDGESTFEKITGEMANDSLRYLVFKGFLSTKEFRELSDSSRKVLETPIIDETGQKVETPSDWFVTGHNIPDHI